MPACGGPALNYGMHALTLFLLQGPETAINVDLAWSASTRARLATLSHPHRRRQFALARLALLTAASQALGQRVALDAIVEQVDDAPVFAPHPQLHTSISHSGDWVAAMVDAHPIGIDIEVPRRRNWGALGRQAFSDGDLAWLNAAPDTLTLQHRFYTLWTLREAAYKGGHRDHVYGRPDVIPTGTTLAFGELAESGPGAGLQWAVSAPLPVRVHVATLTLDDYLAAVAA